MQHLHKNILCVGLLLLFCNLSFAQGPKGKDFGFGIILGEPLGGTVKLWTAPDQAVTGAIGESYFGALRINADYIWHFDAFHSHVAMLYAGPGLSVGFGRRGVYYGYYKNHGDKYYYFDNREEGQVGIGARVMVGLNVIPKRTPIELFLEVGPLIGISPGFGASFDAAIGIRFYP